eukprot:8981596-Alexandrium_andersonii.AAC.1
MSCWHNQKSPYDTAAKLVRASSEQVRKTQKTRGPVLGDRSLSEFAAQVQSKVQRFVLLQPVGN